MREKPDVPKRLAAKLRAVYEKVRAQRDRLAHAEALVVHYQHRVDEFEDDPERFAQLHYPRHEVESYPVQTTMERTRENLEYRQRRMAVYIEDVATAELLKIKAELEVVAELNAMRANTPGRVPWPREPRTLEAMRKESLAWHAKERKRSNAYVLKREKQQAVEAEKRRLEHARAMKENDDRMEFRLSLMPPLRAAAERAYWQALRAAFSRPGLTIEAFSELANGSAEAHQRIIDDAIDRFNATTGLELKMEKENPSEEGLSD